MTAAGTYRILLVSVCGWPGAGSEPGTAWNWILHLGAAGHQVTLLTTPWTASKCREALRTVPGLTLRVAPMPALFPGRGGGLCERLRYVGWLQNALRTARRLVAETPFDLVHHITFGSLPLGSPFYRLPCRSVFGPAGGGQIAPAAFRKYFGAAWPAERLRSWLVRGLRLNPATRRMLRKTGCTLCANPATLDLARRMGAPQPELFFDFAMTAEELQAVPPRVHPPSPPYTALWIGRLAAHKALPLALDAMACLPAHLPVTLNIYGHGPQREALPSMIRARGLAQRVVYAGSVPRARMLEILDSADFLLFTSLRESGGAQLSEAMAHGLPIVMLDHPGASGAQAIVTPEAGLKVPLTTPQQAPPDLAAAIGRLLDNPGSWSRLSAGARQRAMALSWPQRQEQIQAIYDRLLRTRPPS